MGRGYSGCTCTPFSKREGGGWGERESGGEERERVGWVERERVGWVERERERDRQTDR